MVVGAKSRRVGDPELSSKRTTSPDLSTTSLFGSQSLYPPLPYLYPTKKTDRRAFFNRSFGSTMAHSAPNSRYIRPDAVEPFVWHTVENLDPCSFRYCCMPVLLVISYTCELDPTTSARVRRCSSLVHSLVPWAGNDVFRHLHAVTFDWEASPMPYRVM